MANFIALFLFCSSRFSLLSLASGDSTFLARGAGVPVFYALIGLMISSSLLEETVSEDTEEELSNSSSLLLPTFLFFLLLDLHIRSAATSVMRKTIIPKRTNTV